MSDPINSDITAEEAAHWWAIPAFREYRSNRKFCTNQTNPWPSDAGLIKEFLASAADREFKPYGPVPYPGGER